MWHRIAGVVLVAYDIWYIYHLGVRGAFEDFWTAILIVLVAVFGGALLVKN